MGIIYFSIYLTSGADIAYFVCCFTVYVTEFFTYVEMLLLDVNLSPCSSVLNIKFLKTMQHLKLTMQELFPHMQEQDKSCEDCLRHTLRSYVNWINNTPYM